jgi:tyrosyl-tRNA synthetase
MEKDKVIESLEQRAITQESDLRYLTAEQQFEKIMARVSELPEPVVSSDDLLERLRWSKKSGEPLRIKFGIDPTGPDIHIGHAVSLLNLRLFQRMGHKVLLVIGDFTGMIGDPSGRLDVRAALTEDEVRANMATYEQQASRIIDLKDKSIERHYNSEWMDKLTIRGWVEIIKGISANNLLQREDFRNRISTGQRLSMAELEYALYMGYDSVVLNPDAELGGIDQYLNMHMCRQMMANAKQKPEIIISYNLLAGTTGERDGQGRLVKMSKSRGNYIPLTASPEDMYGKVMSIPDEIMWIWYRELTELTRDEINLLKQLVEREDLHPKDVKQLLARIVVGTFNYFDRQIIEVAERDFNTKFGKDALLTPDSVEVLRINSSELLIDRLTQVTNRSKNEVRRLLQQQGVRILKGGEYIPIGLDEVLQPTERFEGAVIKIGKRHYYRFEV